MKFSTLLQSAALFTTALAGPISTVQATVSNEVAERDVAGGIVELAILIAELVNEKHNAYDTDLGDMCWVFMSTYAGSGCYVSVKCGDGRQTANYQGDHLTPVDTGETWNVCYLGGRQYFHHDGPEGSIGDFSIQFTQAGGQNGNTRDGLHNPYLQVAGIGNWEVIDVEGEASHQPQYNLCTSVGEGDGKMLAWTCGIPRIGSSYYNTSNAPAIQNGYAAGQCRIHVVEHQIPEGQSAYRISAYITDNNDQTIGRIGNPYSTTDYDGSWDATNTIDMTSELPYMMIIDTPKLDNDPMRFGYAGQSWSFDDQDGGAPQHCSVGKYDSGARQADCWFQC